MPESFLDYVRYAQLVAQLGFFSTTFFCFILNVYSHNAGFVVYSTSRPFNMTQDAVTWFIVLYTGVYATTISMLSVQFLYRYWAIFDEKKLSFFKGWRFLICIAYSLYFGIQWALGTYYFGKIDDYAENYLRLEMMQKYSTDFSEIAGMTLVAYDKDGNIRWFNICCTLNQTFIMMVQYSVIIYCGIWMYIEIEEKIVTPTVTLFLPVIIIIYLPFLDLECDLPTGIFLSAFTLYPAMDAIIVMYIVADYREAAKTMLKEALHKVSSWLGTVETDKSSTRARSTATNLPAALSPN
ncbi:hypothetical protein GCK72_017349 [Caenorhabditis remanei]|uniref:Uncharacterized protein n=1 Tax=Caenorhabditis remanei TaxID=31234 RepID=A0A6A5G6V5_CAERE|nr:hypothetical protein GCK72_017349 [Caenorhabditis remanei]KAF1750798.1 hypothetical protein GCK72_017349 [Caenorhabditis remanei]